MRTFVVTPPPEVVTLEEAVMRLKMDDADDEAVDIEGMIQTAVEHLDGPDGWLGRALGLQTLEVRLDDWGDGGIELPCRPIVDIVSVKFLDDAGLEQTLDQSGYELRGAMLGLTFRKSWPKAAYFPGGEPIRIRYRAGYQGDIPAPIKSAILLMVGDLYANRETTIDGRATGAVEVPMSTTVTNLLTPLRIWA